MRVRDLHEIICRRCRFREECSYSYGCPAFTLLKNIMRHVKRVHEATENIIVKLETWDDEHLSI